MTIKGNMVVERQHQPISVAEVGDRHLALTTGPFACPAKRSLSLPPISLVDWSPRVRQHMSEVINEHQQLNTRISQRRPVFLVELVPPAPHSNPPNSDLHSLRFSEHDGPIVSGPIGWTVASRSFEGSK